jgi:hypothetical protein
MHRLVALAIALSSTACTTTKEINAKPFELPTAEDIKAAELADWDNRQSYLKRSKVVSEDATVIELVAVINLNCEPMFNSWAECKYDFELLSDAQMVTAKDIFGQFTPQNDGRWKSDIILWHIRRRN